MKPAPTLCWREIICLLSAVAFAQGIVFLPLNCYAEGGSWSTRGEGYGSDWSERSPNYERKRDADWRYYPPRERRATDRSEK
jgi:hypothetical protein